MNALLSDQHAENFASLGDVIGKDKLTDKQKNNEPSWTWVEEAFINPDDADRGNHNPLTTNTSKEEQPLIHQTSNFMIGRNCQQSARMSRSGGRLRTLIARS